MRKLRVVIYMRHWWIRGILSLIWTVALVMACIAIANSVNNWLAAPLLPPHVLISRSAEIAGWPIMARIIGNMIAIMAGFGYAPIWSQAILVFSGLIVILLPYFFHTLPNLEKELKSE